MCTTILSKRVGSNRPAVARHGNNGWDGGTAFVYYAGVGWVPYEKIKVNQVIPETSGEAFVSRHSTVFAPKIHGQHGWQRFTVNHRRYRVIYHFHYGWMKEDRFEEVTSTPPDFADLMVHGTPELSPD